MGRLTVAYLDGDRWLDGPALCAWLEDKLTGRRRHPNLTRRMSSWRRGRSRADLYLVDVVLTEIGIHPIEIPDECWAADQRHHTGKK